MTEQDYAEMFRLLGRPLGEEDAVPADEIDAAAAVLGCRVPEPLRAFYRVGGRAVDFIDHHDHFLPPEEWSLEDGKLVFLAENQGVVLWAVGTEHAYAIDDPPVFTANNEEPLDWKQVAPRCSDFLEFMVIWEAGFGGAMPVTGSAIVEEGLRSTLAKSLRTHGELDGGHAYSGPGLAVCMVEWADDWMILVGAVNEEAMTPLFALGVRLEINSRSGPARPTL